MARLDATGRIVEANPALGAIFGRPCEALQGSLFKVWLSDEAGGWLEGALAQGFDALRERDLELPDGKLLWIDGVDLGGEGGFVVCVRDVTRRRLLKDATQARRRWEALADLAASTSRELTDPMSIVQGRLELVLEMGLGDALKTGTHLAVALEHARRISAILHNLRLVGRSVPTALDRVPAEELMAECLDIVGPRGQGRVKWIFEPPDLAMGGDIAVLARVVSSLIRRTLDGATPGSTIWVQGRWKGDEVSLCIAPGSASAPTPDSAIQAGKAEEEGSLELSIARTLLEGVGAEVRTLRFSGQLGHCLRLAPAPARRVRNLRVDGRVLVVGSSRIADELERILDRDGLAFERAGDAERALEILARDDGFDGVVSELLLPGRSALSLVGELSRRFPKLRSRCVILMDPGLARPPVGVTALSWPVDRWDLLEALGRKVVRRRG